MKPLTPEQVENWRVALAQRFGAAAYTFSIEEIEAIRGKIQAGVTSTNEQLRRP